jgi:hypothetical protein
VCTSIIWSSTLKFNGLSYVVVEDAAFLKKEMKEKRIAYLFMDNRMNPYGLGVSMGWVLSGLGSIRHHTQACWVGK